jgi:hypothetical protein
MQPEMFFPIGAGLGFVVLIALAIRHRRKQMRAFMDGMSERGIRVTVDSFTEIPTAHFDDGGARATLCPDATGGKSSIPLWKVEVSGVALGRRSTVTLSRAGALTSLARAVGFGGVPSGDASFDSRVKVDGSDPGVLRGILREPALRHAISSFFAQRPEVYSCELSANGTLSVRVRRTRMNVPEGLAQVERVRGLASALGTSVLSSARRR